jgi:serine acetyltransferase
MWSRKRFMLKVSGAGPVTIGQRTTIGEGAEVVFAGPGSLTIGDYCTIGPGVRFIISGGDVLIDDWTSVHNSGLVLSTVGVRIGQHGWFGQNTILDGSGGLTIGHGVRVGMYSQIWSHVAAGEQIEGCTLFGQRSVDIGNHVWLVGSCIVASGVNLGERLVALIGSNITKSFPAHVTIAGVPAAERANLSFYKPITLDEKMALLQIWLQEISTDIGAKLNVSANDFMLSNNDERVIFLRDAGENPVHDSRTTIACVSSKRYMKKLTNLEQKIFKALSGNKARFLRWDIPL